MNKKVKEVRNYFRSIRFTKDEDTQIVHDAKRCGLGVATYLRQKGLGLRPRAKDFSHIINTYSKQGGLLKHLHNKGLGNDQQTAELLLDMKKTVRKIHDMLSEVDGDDRENPEKTE